MNKYVRFSLFALAAVVAALALLLLFGPAQIEKMTNRVLPHEAPAPAPEAVALHQTLTIGDLHADTLLWQRDLLKRGDYGQVDLPRLLEGNVAMQMFTVPTRSPRGQNYESNASDTGDNIRSLAMLQAWPPSTWSSLAQRALYMAGRLERAVQRSAGNMLLVRNRQEFAGWLARRGQGERTLAALLGTEGSHALDGELDNIDRLRDAGFTMMSLQHFFDNRLGGSLHGASGAGLSSFGQDAVRRMLSLGIMIDVSHSSPRVVEDVLDMGEAPLLVSHTGFYGHCRTPRNISDELMQRIAARGGLIGVGYWDAAVCDFSADGIAAAIRYGIDLLGENHVALGSDYDGGVTTRFDTSELVLLTDAMLRADFSPREIRKVMGENMLRFLLTNLPDRDS